MHDYLRIFLKNSSQKARKDQEQKDRELEAAAKGKKKAKVCTQASGRLNLTLHLQQPDSQ